MERCSCCQLRLQKGGLVHPLWPNLPMCHRCTIELPRCIACEKKVLRKDDVVCASCMKLNPVVSQPHALGCFWKAIKFLERYLNLSVLPLLTEDGDDVPTNRSLYDIPATPRGHSTVRLYGSYSRRYNRVPRKLPQIGALDADELIGCSVQDGHATVFGRCDLRYHKRQYQTRYVHGIYCLKYLPECLFTAHLCHELVHVYIFLIGCAFADPALEECFCNAAAILYLRQCQEDDQLEQFVQRQLFDAVDGHHLELIVKDILDGHNFHTLMQSNANSKICANGNTPN